VSGLVTSTAVPILVRGNAAEFVSQTALTSLYTREQRSINVTMRNTGTTTWQPGSVLLMADNPEDNQRWGLARVPLNAVVAPGAETTFTFNVTAPAEPGTNPMQWRMLDTAIMVAFGAASTQQDVAILARPAPLASLSATPRNVRVAPGQAANITLAASASIAANGDPLSKLELFQDTGSGYGSTPVRSVSGSGPTLNLDGSMALGVGSYRLLLRATDSNGKTGEAAPVLINVADSPLLGLVSGVRATAVGQLQLVGWACRSGSDEALNYEVFANAPPALGGILLGSGSANTSGQPSDAAVRQQCATADSAHHFIIDLASLQAPNPGAPLYVRTSAANGQSIVLPCEDHGCRMPEGLRIGLTSPNANNLDRFRTPLPAFLRAVVSGFSTAPDEVSFEIDGQPLPAVVEAGSAWSATKAGLAARAVPYVAVAKVRQGDTIVISEERQFYIDPPIEPGTVLPPNGSVVGQNQPVTLSTVVNAAAQPGQSVKFFIVKRAAAALRAAKAMSAAATGETTAEAVFDGAKWTFVWTPTESGIYDVTAKLLAGDGTVLMQTPTVTITVSITVPPTDATPVPVVVPPPPVLANGEGGTLPGSISVGSNGTAGYSIPIQLPPGILGMVPAISLNYDSGTPTGSSGLGWSIGGFAHIERCGKVIATDGKGDGVRFLDNRFDQRPVDRLCLNGQRLVLVSGDVNDNAAYWAANAEYRTEIESFTRITALGASGSSGFKVETKDGRTSYYGDTADSHIEGAGRSDGLAHRWYMSRSSDHSGNTISYTYNKDASTGENKPASVSWGANSAQNTPHFARVNFVYETRPDARLGYLAGSRLDERLRLKTIASSVDVSNDSSGNWVPALTYTLAYTQSPSSGRSLLQSVTACDVERCLPATTLRYGERDPAATPGFVALGGTRTGPNLDMMAHDSSMKPYENIIAADFNGDGRTDLLEMYRLPSNGSTQRMYEANADGSGWRVSTPLAGLPQAHSVLEAADFDGDGLIDLLVADSGGVWRICPGRLRSGGAYSCDTPAALPADAMVIMANNKLRIARDFNADGKDDLFLRTAPASFPGYKAYQCLSTGTGFDCITVTGTRDEKSMGDDRGAEPFGPSAYTDVDGDGRVDVLLIPKCDWIKPENETRFRWVCGTTGYGEEAGGILAYSEPERGAVLVDGGWLQYPDKKTGVVPQLRSASLVGDLNADGYSDMVLGTVNLNIGGSISTGEGVLCLSTGDGSGNCRPISPTGQVGGIDRAYLPLAVGDFDGDGVVDVLRPIEDSWNNTNIVQGYQLCHVNTDGEVAGSDYRVFQRCEPWSGPTFYTMGQRFLYDNGDLGLAGVSSSFMGDFDGDGKQDIVTYLGGDQWQVHAAAKQSKPGEALDKLVAVTNGAGNQERVVYALPNDSSVYQQAVARPDGNNAIGKLIYPARPLVKSVHRDNGPSGTRSTTYRYARMAMDGSGRGNLGFAQTTQTDEQRWLTSTSWPCLSFPHIGSECGSRQVADTFGTVLNDVTNEWASTSYAQPGGGVTSAPYLRKSTVVRRDLMNMDFGKTVTVVDVVDAWGNVLNTATTSSNDANPVGWTVSKAMTYDNDSSTWRLGELRSLTETRANNHGAVTRVMRYTYDGKGLLATELRDSNDLTQKLLTTYERGGLFGQVTRQLLDWRDPASGSNKTRAVSEMGYTSNGRFAATVKNAVGHVEQRTFDARTGRAASVTTANGLSSLMTSDGFGRERSILTPEGNLIETTYRNCGIACPAGATQVLLKESKRMGGIVRTAPPSLQYADNANHVLRTVSWGFDGRLIASDVRYDELGRAQKVFWPRFISDSEALDSLYGDPAGANLRSVSYYDVWDRPWITQTVDESGALQSTTHTWLGFRHETKNPLQQVISETRDVWGKLETAVDANGKSTAYRFDAFGNLARTTDSKGNVVQVSYDDWGRRTELLDPDLGKVSYSVDPLGQVWKQVSPKQLAAGDATTMQYDALGRMTVRSAADSTANWTYDVLSDTDCALAHSCGQLVQSKTLAGPTMADFVQQHSYDALGRPDTTTTVLDVQYTSRREYDDWGRLITERHQREGSASRDYARRYNMWGLLERIERNGQAIWTATAADASGRISSAQLGNGLGVVQSFDPYTGRLSNGTVGSQLSEGYSYDVLGNVKSRTQQWGPVSFVEAFEYDGLNRLRQSTITGYPAQVFDYDDIGNLTSKTGVGSGNYQYPGAGQPRPHAVSGIPGIGSFSYDANGNLENGAGRTITWNSFDMPVTISRGSDSSTFYYGADHQRVKQVRGGTTIWYAGALEVEIGGPQTVIKTYLPNALGVEIDKSGVAQLYYTHRDRLGSVMALSDQTGVLSEMLAYDSWGKRREQATPATPDALDGQVDNKGFTGHEMLDQLDLVHMNGRVYDPLVARFVSADPYIQSPRYSQSFNRYSYVWNNPTNLIDPTGFMAADAMLLEEDQERVEERPEPAETQNEVSQAARTTRDQTAFAGSMAAAATGMQSVIVPGRRPWGPVQQFEWDILQREARAKLEVVRSVVGGAARTVAWSTVRFIATGVTLALTPGNAYQPMQTCSSCIYNVDDSKDAESLSNDTNSGGKDGAKVESPVPGATEGEKTGGGTRTWTKPGGFDEANKDFDKMNPSNVGDKGNGVRVGTLEDGRRVIVRPDSSDGRPTIEIQRPDGKRAGDKIRYD
jgi:RHS repeat-associated protein